MSALPVLPAGALCAGCVTFFAGTATMPPPPVHGVVLEDGRQPRNLNITLEDVVAGKVRPGSAYVVSTGQHLPMYAVTMVAGTWVCAEHAKTLGVPLWQAGQRGPRW